MGDKYKIEVFDPDNPELYLLALEAAIEIGNYMNSKNSSGKYARHLSELINDLTQGDIPPIKRDFSLSNILAYSISGREDFRRFWARKGNYLDNVLLQTNLVAKDLRDFRNLSKEKLRFLEEFCLNLSDELQNYTPPYPIDKTSSISR